MYSRLGFTAVLTIAFHTFKHSSVLFVFGIQAIFVFTVPAIGDCVSVSVCVCVVCVCVSVCVCVWIEERRLEGKRKGTERRSERGERARRKEKRGTHRRIRWSQQDEVGYSKARQDMMKIAEKRTLTDVETPSINSIKTTYYTEKKIVDVYARKHALVGKYGCVCMNCCVGVIK